MLYTAYYLVRLREERRGQVFAILGDSTPLVAGPELFSKVQGGRTTQKCADWIREVKLLYLASLHDEYIVSPQNVTQGTLADSFGRLLGPPPWGEHTFDTWWSVAEVPFTEEAEGILARVSEATFAAVPGLRDIRPR